jgi:hypothetical protein
MLPSDSDLKKNFSRKRGVRKQGFGDAYCR